jgi:flagellin
MTSEINSFSRINNQLSGSKNSLFKKLSSGKNIAKASDNPAGLAIANNLASEVSLSSQAKRNISYGSSVLAVAEGSLSILDDIGTRMAELAASSANGVLSDEQRKSLDNEFQQLKSEANRIVETTQFNGLSILKDTTISIQSGTDGSANSSLNLGQSGVSSAISSLSNLNLTNSENSKVAIDTIKDALAGFSSARGLIGSLDSRLSYASNNLDSVIENSEAARSRIEDLDYAQAMAEQSSLDIRQQMNVALMAQSSKLERSNMLGLLSS